VFINLTCALSDLIVCLISIYISIYLYTYLYLIFRYLETSVYNVLQ